MRRRHLQVTDTYSTNCPANGETCSSFTVESDKFYGPVVTSDATAAPAAFQGLDWTVSAPPRWGYYGPESNSRISYAITDDL